MGREAQPARQRARIAELASTLNASPVRYWLIGGWAVDAHLGRTTRQHSDIDLAVFVADRAGLVDALGKLGLVPAPGVEGVEVPVLSIKALIDTKMRWQDHIGEPMRPHDRADLDALHALI